MPSSDVRETQRGIASSNSDAYQGGIMRAVFDLVLPLERAAEGYAAMDKRRATKVMLTV